MSSERPKEPRQRNRRLQRAVRARMAETGENYTKALRAILEEKESNGSGETPGST
jgi:hypothetical protein